MEKVFPQYDCTSNREDLDAWHKDVCKYHEDGTLGIEKSVSFSLL